MAYLFAHFKEKLTPDGEQVYFAVSKDGFNWESLNGGEPILESTMGECGCRDIEVVRLVTGGFVILTTDLCVVHRMDGNYNIDWIDINRHGSKKLNLWRTDDLIHFSSQQQIYFGRDDFGCLWAPEVIYDEENEEYLIHWGSMVKETDYRHMSIYCSVTKDFKEFSYPKVFFDKKNEILDSHIVKIGGKYHLFYKNANDPSMNMHAVSENLYGPYEHDKVLEEYMASLGNAGAYEGPTSYVLPDGRWCLMLDFFGCEKPKMGYVPFVASSAGASDFKMDKEEFSFPYGFKHGKVLEINEDEYASLKQFYNK